MATTVTGSYSATFTANTLVPVSATNSNAYSVPISMTASQTYASGTTGPSTFAKTASIVVTSGTGLVTYDFFKVTTGSGAVLCSDGTFGFSHIREFMIVNQATTNAYDLLLDSTVATPWFVKLITTAGANTKILLPAGGCFHFSCPINTVGLVVDNSNKLLGVDSASNVVPYTILVGGD